MYTLGESIAALRRKKGLTQEALASVIGVSPQSISKWETGEWQGYKHKRTIYE